MFFIQEKAIHGWGKCNLLGAIEHPPQGILGKSEFCKALEEVMWKNECLEGTAFI